MTDVNPESRRPIRAWRSHEAGRAATLRAAFIATAKIDAEAARRFGRALRAERRRAGRRELGYDLDRHAALARAVAALAEAAEGR
jgi:hypothetical protein